MGDRTGISWTDKTWNPWHGCHKVSPGCAHCYMFRDKKRYGQNPEMVVRSKTSFHDPLKWRDPAKVFTCSWSDFFIEEADAWRGEAWDIIRRTPHLTYQILTKRPERITEHLPKDWDLGYKNVWLGISAENQRMYDRRLPQLLSNQAVLFFVSLEPLLGTVDLCLSSLSKKKRPEWFIVGCESGAKRRPTPDGAIEAIAKQCANFETSLWVKQMEIGGKVETDVNRFPTALGIQEFSR